MKILLVNMPWKSGGLWGVRAGSRWPHLRHPLGEKDYLPYPFFLGYATALLRQNGYDAKLIDAIAEKIEVPEFLKLVEREKPDLIVAETSTPSLNYDLMLLQRLRDTAPVVVCGPEYNIRQEVFLKKNSFIDYVMVGEYEYTLLELVENLETERGLSQIKGLIFRKDGEVYYNGLRELIKDLDQLPWPWRKDLPMECYVDAPGGMPLPCAQMWTSRGCPYRCIFCLWPHIMYHGNSYRMRDPEKVVDEMEFLIKEMKFRSIYIDDDTTNVNKKNLIQIANEIKRRKLKFPWAIMARPDLMDKELLKILRSAGLYAVKYGVESAEQRILDLANKNMNLEYALEMIRYTQKLGIKTHLTFTFGLPGETRESIQKTINLALKLNPYSVQFSINTPFPGTTYYSQLKAKGWKEPEDWSLFDGHKAAVIESEELSKEYLEDVLNKAYKLWFEHKHQELMRKSIWQEAKTFYQLSKLYGLKFAREKKGAYLQIKRQLQTEAKQEKKSQEKNTDFIKGILSGREAYTGPQVVVLDLTDKCNLNCIGCWLHSPLIKRGEKKLDKSLDTKCVKNLIDEFSKLNVQEIQLSGGGEPLLHPDIFEIIAYIKSKGMKCQLITNFTLLNKHKIDKIISLGLDNITISLWAGDFDTYQKVHPGVDKKVFLNIESNLKYLIKTRGDKPLVRIYNVISSLNYKNIPQMLNFALKTGADFLEFQLMDPIPDVTEHLLLNPIQAEEVRNIIAELKGRQDYVSDFISDEEILDYEHPWHKRELKDFGRFVKGHDKNFTLINGIRQARCRNGKFSIIRKPEPPHNVRNVKYYFDQESCKNCKFYRDCYRNSKDYPFQINLLSILGVETFLRRVNSIANTRKYLDGKIIDTLPCYAGWGFVRITTAGDIKPCCKADEMTLGNIKDKSFSEVWFSSSYNEFRHKCKYLPKCDDFFKSINCYKVCDNLGMNLAIHKEVLKNIKQIPVSSKIEIQKNKIVIPARSYHYGNLNRDGNIFGKNLVIDGGEKFGYALYKFSVPDSSKYELWTKYAAEIPRPVNLTLDGKYLGKIAKTTTGGWTARHLKYFQEMDVFLGKGEHTIELFSPDCFPHLERIELRKKEKKSQKFYADPACVYKTRKPLSLFRESLHTHGLKFTLARTAKFLKPRNIINNYLDIIGILDGRYGYKGPFHVQIDLTNTCNNNCIGCWCNSPLLEEKRMPPEVKSLYLPVDVVKELLDEIKALGASEVYYSGGGEPFTHPDIMEILEYTKKLGLTCYVNTNFTLIDKDKIDRLISAGIDHLTVSIWAGTAETYARTHPNKNESTFYDIKERLQYLNTRKIEKPYIKLYEVIFTMNYQEIREMIDFARVTGCESVEFTLIDTIPGKTDKLALKPSETAVLYKICKEIEKELTPDFNYHGVHLFRFDQFIRRISDEHDVVEAKYDRNIIDSIPCYIGWLFARILPDGNVNSCLKSHRFPVGNLYEKTFSEIWNSNPQMYFRQKTLCYKKEDRFFRLIGNDPDIQEAGCYKSCDDIGRNLHMHKKIMSLTKPELLLLKLIAKYKKSQMEKRRERLVLYRKELPSIDDKVILGIIDGRKAYQGPEHVVVDLTNRCQLKCISCWLYSPYLRQSKPSPEWLKQTIPLEIMKKCIQELSDLGLKIIRFTGGGEPLLYPKILELIELAKSKGIKTCVTTNFYGLSDDFVKELLKLNLDELAVSLWAGDPDTYTKLHPGTKPEDFLKIKEQLYYYNTHKNNTKVTIANVICNLNHNNVFKMAELAKEVKADAVYYTLVDVFKEETDFLVLRENDYIELEKEFQITEKYLKDNCIEIENLNGFKERIASYSQTAEYDRRRIDSIPCYVGWFFARILANGEVVPCCRGANYPMGNINKLSFSEIWFSKKYNGFRSRAKYLKKDQPYFWKMNCYKECDNFMHNQDIHCRVNRIYRQ
ncbi:MAG: radical SAM protein [Candidatus Omnitrophica bacterium]|nr:radical SAM protein [Candidatus Omnitrophota bacterium]